MVLILSFVNVYSSGLPSIVLSSQDPDPVSPGNYVELSFRVSNPGENSISNLKLQLVENRYVTLAPNEDEIVDLGSIPAQSNSESGFTTAKVRVYIEDNAPVGSQEVRVKLINGVQESFKDFLITVREENPSLSVNVIQSIEELTYKPGEQKPLTLELENFNSIDMKNVKISIDTDVEISSGVETQADYYIVQGTNVQRIDSIDSNTKSSVSFTLGISPTASIQPYQIPVTVEYSDVLGNDYTEEFDVTVLVNADVDLLLTLDRVENGRVTFGIANPGPGIVKGAFVEITNSVDEVIGAEYIGDLNADDFQTVQIEYTPSAELESEDVTLKVDFSDGYYTADVEEKVFTIDGTATSERSSSSPIVLIIIVILIIVGAYFLLFRKRKVE